MTILPSKELVSKIEKSEMMYMKDRMEAIQQRPGNPEGVEIQYFGQAMCLYSQTMPWSTFNTVKGLSTEDLPYLDAIIDFYKMRDRKVNFEIVPSRVDETVLTELSKRGFHQSSFHTSTYCSPKQLTWNHSDEIVLKEAGKEDFTTYAMIHCRGTGLSDDGIPHVAENNKVLYKRPGWKHYIVYVSGQPAAAGVMHTKEGISSLTFAATLPEFRKIGLHQSLIDYRITEAFHQQSELVVGQCAYLSQSHRNMERAGMKIGYVRTTWT